MRLKRLTQPMRRASSGRTGCAYRASSCHSLDAIIEVGLLSSRHGTGPRPHAPLRERSALVRPSTAFLTQLGARRQTVVAWRSPAETDKRFGSCQSPPSAPLGSARGRESEVRTFWIPFPRPGSSPGPGMTTELLIRIAGSPLRRNDVIPSDAPLAGEVCAGATIHDPLIEHWAPCGRRW